MDASGPAFPVPHKKLSLDIAVSYFACFEYVATWFYDLIVFTFVIYNDYLIMRNTYRCSNVAALCLELRSWYSMHNWACIFWDIYL